MSILLDKKVRGIKQKSIIPYLHSAVKQRSYHTNAQAHVGDKYVFAIDLRDFYPSVTKYKLYLFFKKSNFQFAKYFTGYFAGNFAGYFAGYF